MMATAKRGGVTGSFFFGFKDTDEEREDLAFDGFISNSIYLGARAMGYFRRGGQNVAMPKRAFF
jgi:hypothetical protein